MALLNHGSKGITRVPLADNVEHFVDLMPLRINFEDATEVGVPYCGHLREAELGF